MGPPLESREPTRLRSAMLKNLQRICLPIYLLCPFRRKSDRKSFALLPTFTISTSFLFLFFFSRVYSYVYTSMCSRVCDVSFFAISRRYVDYSNIVHLPAWFFLVFNFLIDVLSDESASGHLLVPADPPPLYIPLISILRLAVFLSLGSLKNRYKRLGRFMIQHFQNA